MYYGFVLPGGSIHEIAELAKLAEEAGWDGVFIPDCIAIDHLDDPASLGFDPLGRVGSDSHVYATDT